MPQIEPYIGYQSLSPSANSLFGKSRLHTPYAASFAPMTMNEKNVAKVRYILTRGEFHLVTVSTAVVGAGSVSLKSFCGLLPRLSWRGKDQISSGKLVLLAFSSRRCTGCSWMTSVDDPALLCEDML